MATGKRSAATVKGPRRDASENCAPRARRKSTSTARIVARTRKVFEWRGRRFTPKDFEYDHTFHLEFDEDEPGELEPMRCIRAELSQWAEVVKSHDGLFFLIWSEAHPHLGDFDEFFGGEKGGRFDGGHHEGHAPRSEENLATWSERQRRFPPADFARPLTRREAFLIVARFYLPSEFFGDAGVD